MRILWLGALISVAALAADTVENLPAGGKYIYQTKWDKVTVNCTAEPATPSVVSQACTCLKYDQHPFMGEWRYKLSQKTLLSSGRVVEMDLVDGLTTVDECESAKQTRYAKACQAR